MSHIILGEDGGNLDEKLQEAQLLFVKMVDD
jgi:hypothetical protein